MSVDDETEFLGRPPSGRDKPAATDDTVVLGDETVAVAGAVTSTSPEGGNDPAPQATLADTGTTQVIGRRGQTEPQLAPISAGHSRWRYLPAAIGLAAVVALVFYFAPSPEPTPGGEDDNVFPQGVGSGDGAK